MNEQSQAVLEVEALCAGYGRVQALHEVSLRLERGRIATVIGPNGAGKSTLLNAIMGVLPASGRVRLDGRDVAGRAVEELVMAGIALVPERRELFTDMSVQDNLWLGSFRRYRAGEREYLDRLDWVYQLFPRLKERHGQLAGTLSGGERQMLAVGRALMGKPRLLMLDEPSLGLAPLIVREILQVIGELRASGVSTLLVEQNARAALHVADYGYVLETGRLVLEGPAEALAKDPMVVEAYLGRSGAATA